MAEKHKSKYKKPENKKPTYRKDLKDYTEDDKKGGMNPFSTDKKQDLVARKTDKPVVDDAENLVPKMTDKDRLYKKVEDGNYDQKHAAAVLRKRQETDTKEYLESLEDIDHGVTTPELQERIKRLTPKQKDQLIREYIRRKIVQVLNEQPKPGDTAEDPNAVTDVPAEPIDAAAATDAVPTDEVPADDTVAAPAPSTPPAPTAPPAATTPTQPAAPATEPTDPETEKAKKITAIADWIKFLKKKQEKGPSTLVQTALSPLSAIIKNLDPKDLERAKKLAIRQIANIQAVDNSEEEEA